MRRGVPHHHSGPIPTSLGLAFPTCVTEALIQVSKHVRLSSHGRNRPALIKNNDLQLLIDNEIFCLSSDRKSSRLSKLQEFTLIICLGRFFEERDEINKYAYFEVLFLGREGESYVHEHRLRLLYRLALYALQHPVFQLYSQISLWLSKVGNTKSYAEDLVAVLAEHYLRSSDSNIYEYLLPLETACPEFTVFFVVYATRFMPINRPMAAVFASYINANPGYFLKGFRDSPHLADIFRSEVFPKMLTYLLKLDCEPSSDQEALNYHTAVLVLLDKWNTNIKRPLDMNLLFDPSVRWSRFRCDAVCIISSRNSAACKFVAEKLEGCKIPPTYAALIADSRSTVMISRLPLIPVGRAAIQIRALRFLRKSSLSSSSGNDTGHVYVPKPAVGERNWLGNLKTLEEQYPHEPSKLRKSDVYTFFGAGVGVVLTLLTLTFYTDIFGKNISKKNHNPMRHESNSHRSKQSERQGIQPLEHSTQSVENEVASPNKQSEAVVSPTNVHDQTSPTLSSSEQVEKDRLDAEMVSSLQRSEIKHGEDYYKEREWNSSQAEEKNSVAFSSPVQSSADGNETVIPSTSDEVPKFVEYLLVGAGTAAYYASLAIRARHADAKVLMIGEETHLPYNRPPLSKELWWYGDEESANTLQYEGLSGKKRDVYFESEGFFVPPSELSATSHGGVSLLRGRRVSKLCPDEKKAYLEDGHCISYSKCLIATGGKPKVLPELENVPENVKGKILYLRGVDDYRKLEEICKSSKSISIVGGGFLGSELAYSIQRKYKNVKITQVVAEKGNLSGIFPEFLSVKASEALRDVGVDVITNAKITAARERDASIEVEVNGSQCIASDCVVVAVGIQPDTLVAEASGLEIDSRSGGISADAELRVRSDIWAAGDAASFYDKTLGRRRIEHWDNAQISGRLAGENMTGAGKAFWYQPAFFSKIAPQWQISAVGITDSSLPTVSVFAKENNSDECCERGVVFYKGDQGKIVGVLLLNVFGSAIDVARRLIDEARNIEDFRQLAKLFQLYKTEKTED